MCSGDQLAFQHRMALVHVSEPHIFLGDLRGSRSHAAQAVTTTPLALPDSKARHAATKEGLVTLTGHGNRSATLRTKIMHDVIEGPACNSPPSHDPSICICVCTLPVCSGQLLKQPGMHPARQLSLMRPLVAHESCVKLWSTPRMKGSGNCKVW